MKLLIGALSGWQYSDRRQMVRETWGPTATAAGHQYHFLMGRPPDSSSVDPDMLVFDVPNEYDYLPQRTAAWCRWAMTQPDWEFAFKCDDDTMVAVNRLEQVIWSEYVGSESDYVGAEWMPGVGYGSGGAGYLMSRRAVEIVAERLTMPRGAEDLLVGAVLRNAGIMLTINPQLIPFGNEMLRPKNGNNLITSHKIPEALFRDSHSQVN